MKPVRGGLPRADCPSPIGWEMAPQAGDGGGIAWRKEPHRDFERA